MKKYVLYMLVAGFVLQLAVPGYLIYRENEVVRKGEELKFEIQGYDPYDPFRGRYIAFRLSLANELRSDKGKFIVFEKEEDGFARIIDRKENEPTDTTLYVKNMDMKKMNKYFINEHLGPIADKYLPAERSKPRHVYITVSVYKGRSVLTAMYVGDEHINDFLLRMKKEEDDKKKNR